MRILAQYTNMGRKFGKYSNHKRTHQHCLYLCAFGRFCPYGSTRKTEGTEQMAFVRSTD